MWTTYSEMIKHAADSNKLKKELEEFKMKNKETVETKNKVSNSVITGGLLYVAKTLFYVLVNYKASNDDLLETKKILKEAISVIDEKLKK